MKKALVAFLVLAMAFCFVGCSKKTTAEATKPAAATTLATTTTATAPAATPKAEEKKAETVTLRVVDWSDSSAAFRADFNKKFEEKHPGVKVEYTCLTIDQFKNTILTMIKGGTAPDLFPIPTPMTLSTALSQDWFLPLDDLFDDQFKATLAPSTFSDGVTTLNGKWWVFPEAQPCINAVMYYNKGILKQYGVEVPKTYSDFVAACKTINEKSGGQVYGLIDGGTQLNRLDILARSLCSMAGGKVAPNGKILTVDGKAPYDSSAMVTSLEFLAKLAAEGCLHPDTVSINAPVAREYFAQGQAAFICQGMWCIPTWQAAYPELEIGSMKLPVPDGQQDIYGCQAVESSSWMGIYKQSKHADIAAEYLKCLFSEEYGYQSAQVSSGNSISIVPAINDKYMTNKAMLEYYKTAESMTRVIPIATKRDEKSYSFYAGVNDVSPSLGAIVQGVLAGSIATEKDIKSYLMTLSNDSTKEWKRAADAAGYDYTHLDFPNWDLSKDYTDSDYAALKK
jgi:multiple sugar transport system substrate-binding protein